MSRRSFAPTVLAGLATAGLAAVASNQQWATATPAEQDAAASTLLVRPPDGAQAPLALALSLVLLAAWGVLLVTRRVVRRAVAVLALLAAVGTVVTVVLGRGIVRDSYREEFEALGLAAPAVDFSAWYWVALVASVLAVVPAVVAVRAVGGWPEMGSRYDAPGDQPGAAAAATADAEETSSLDLWKAIDEGRDPTR